MSAIAELTRALIASGMEAGAACALVARAAVELSACTPSKAAARTRRWREKKASQTVTERHAVTSKELEDSPSQTVTNRHGDVTGDDAHISILTSDSDNKEKPKEVKKIEAPREKRASRISADWQVEPRHTEYAISKGVAPERIPNLGEKFKNHWLSANGKGSVSPNWFLKWCTWVMNDVEWNGTQNGQRPSFNRAYSTSGAQQSSSDAVLAGVAAATGRRARARGQGQLQPDPAAPGEPEAELFGAGDG